MLVILSIQLDLDAAKGIDLVNGDLSALQAGSAIYCGRAGERTDEAHLDCAFGEASGAGEHHSCNE